MSTESLRLLLRSLRQAAGLHADAPEDAALLDRWLSQRDELAFEVLVWRHGSMVLGVCRRILRRGDDVEDAFQATFLTLVRQAARIRDRNALGAWLHRVAHRIALRARGPVREWPLEDDVVAVTADTSELSEVLDREIDRLPERYRRVVVLCWLQGHTQVEAARLLGVPAGTVSSLLSRGRERLQRRLRRAGLEPRPASPPVPSALVGPAVALVGLTVEEIAGAVPAHIAELSSGVIIEMNRPKILSALAVVVAVALLAVGLPFVAVLLADDKKEKDQPEPPVTFSFFTLEPFNEKLRLAWKPIRPDEKYVSLTKNKGKLTITTQRGSIHADETTRGDPKAKNLYVIDNPLAEDADFEAITCISNFTPKQQYQQAALICYDDDDNYIKWSYQFSWRKGQGTDLTLVRETKAETKHDTAESPEDTKQVWLRLTRRKGDYEYASSSDGKKWTVHGTVPWGEKGPAKIGILAKNGGIAGVPEVEVCFDRFWLRSPPPPAKKE